MGWFSFSLEFSSSVGISAEGFLRFARDPGVEVKFVGGIDCKCLENSQVC